MKGPLSSFLVLPQIDAFALSSRSAPTNLSKNGTQNSPKGPWAVTITLSGLITRFQPDPESDSGRHYRKQTRRDTADNAPRLKEQTHALAENPVPANVVF